MDNNEDSLLNGLASLGCEVRDADGYVFITLPDEQDEFVYERMGEWLYLGTTFMTPEELEGAEHVSALDRFLLELQHRNLGCHFSYDGSGYLTLGAELYPEQQHAQEVLHVMEQISFVIDASLSLCDEVLESGSLPPDLEVDKAFGLLEKLH